MLEIREIAEIPLKNVKKLGPLLLQFQLPKNHLAYYKFSSYLKELEQPWTPEHWNPVDYHFREFTQLNEHFKSYQEAFQFNYESIRNAECFLTNGNSACSIVKTKTGFSTVLHRDLYSMVAFLKYKPQNFSIADRKIASSDTRSQAIYGAFSLLNSPQMQVLTASNQISDEPVFMVGLPNHEWVLHFRGKPTIMKNMNTGYTAGQQLSKWNQDGFRLKNCLKCKHSTFGEMSNIARDTFDGWTMNCQKIRDYVSITGLCPEFESSDRG